jgi:hypothetical protein
MKAENIKLSDLSKYPKVPMEMDIEFLHKKGIYSIPAGWYCLPLINGLVRYSEALLKVTVPQEDEATAFKACMVHNTFDGKMTEAESISLIKKEIGL